MAPASRLPSVLPALLILGAVLAPSSGAQDAAGAIVVGTDRASYPPGGPVRLTLRNVGSADLAFTEAGLDIHTGGAHVASLPLAPTLLAPGEELGFAWSATVDGAPAPPGSYLGVFWYNETHAAGAFSYPHTHAVAVVNPTGEEGWVLQAGADAAEPGRLDVRTGRASATYAPGEHVEVVWANVGTADLVATNACGVRFNVTAADGSVAYESAAGTVCAEVEQRLAPGATLARTWDGRDLAREPLAPGTYRLTAAFGPASAAMALTIAAPETAPADAPPAAIALEPPPAPVPHGAAAALDVRNPGGTDLEGSLTLEVRGPDGALVHAATLEGVRVPAGEGLALTWDARIAGAPAPAGAYHVRASLAEAVAEAVVHVAAPASPPPDAPAGPDPDPSGDGAAAPAEGKPVVGRIGGNASGAGAETPGAGPRAYQGDWVSLQVDAAAGRVLDFRAGGRLVLVALDLPGGGPARVEAVLGAIVVRGPGATLTAFDTPAGAVRLEGSPGAEVALRLPAGARVHAEGGGARVQAPGYDALVVVHGGGAVQAEGADVAVRLGAPEGAGSAGFVLRTWGGVAPAVPAAQASPAPSAGALSAAIARERVAAEVYLAPAPDGASGVAASVVPYIAVPVDVGAAQRSAEGLTVTFDVADPRARTLVFHLGAGLMPPGPLQVLYDGAPVAAAAGVEDVLDPDDDGLRPEFYLVANADGSAQLLLSVPHFSPHTVQVQGLLEEVAPWLAPYGAAAALAMVLAAGAYLVRRGRSD